MKRLEEIKARLNRAAPGEWSHDPADPVARTAGGVYAGKQLVAVVHDDAVGEFIAAAKDDICWLIDALEGHVGVTGIGYPRSLVLSDGGGDTEQAHVTWFPPLHSWGE